MTHEEFEALWLESLREEAADTVSLLGCARKKERERRTCAAFLRCAGVPFDAALIASSTTEPPDVVFDSARFEITIVLEQNRPLHDDWKDIAARRSSAQRIEELMTPYRPPEVLSRQEIVDLITPPAAKKAEQYLGRGLALDDLDLLVYVDRNVVLAVESPKPVVDALLRRHGWRSVSVLIPPNSYVVHASDNAPLFLRHLAGEPRAEWRNPFGLFDI